MLVATALFFALPSSAQDTGHATWINLSNHGAKTASGERYDHKSLTASHADLPFDSMVRVTNTETMASVVVRINDRSSANARSIIDLSGAAAKELGLFANGPQEVSIEVMDFGNDISIASSDLASDEAEMIEVIQESGIDEMDESIAREIPREIPNLDLPLRVYEQPTVPAPDEMLESFDSSTTSEMSGSLELDSETGMFTLQIGSFSSIEGAQELAKQFKEAWILAIESGDAPTFRVYFNRFDQEEPARTAQNRLWSEGHDSFLRKVGP